MVGESNCLIGVQNFVDSTFVVPIMFGGSWEAQSPLENLQTDRLADTARSTDTDIESTQFEIDFDTTRNTRLLALPVHTMDRDALARVRASNFPAWLGVALTNNESISTTTFNVTAIGNAYIIAGQRFRLPNDVTNYKVTSGIILGENNFIRTEEFDDAAWTKIGATVIANPTIAPDDTASADTLKEDSSNGEHSVDQEVVTADDTDITISVFAKERTRSILRISVIDKANVTRHAYFNLSDATLGSADAGLETRIRLSSKNFYECVVRVNVGAGGTTPKYTIALANADGNVTYTGDGISSLFIWGAQHTETIDVIEYVKAVAAPISATSGNITITPGLSTGFNADDDVKAISGNYINEVATDSDFTEVFGTVVPWGSVPWGDIAFWDGKIDEESAQGLNVPFIHILAGEENTQYWKVEIDNTTNPAGFVDLSRLFISKVWEPTINIRFGNLFGVKSNTTVETAPGSARFYDEEQPERFIVFEVGDMDEDEMLVNPFEQIRTKDKSKQLMFIFDKSDTFHMHRRAFMCNMSDLGALKYQAFQRISVTYKLQEVIA